MTPNASRARVDLHLHSFASNTTDYYAANAFGIPESHSDPLQLHPLLKRRGMRLVTLSDHNTIDGALRMLDAGLPDVFISAEMTTTFPEDGCNIHVVVTNVTEAQFRDANRLRGNVYEMVAYLDQEIARPVGGGDGNQLAYFMAHPLMSTQNRPYGRAGALSLAHIEKAVLLFDTFEARNGARTRALNELTTQLFASLTPGVIERLACKHSLTPKGETPWLKSFVGGSDDHSGINPGMTWTECDDEGGPLTPNQLVGLIRQRRTRPGGAHGGPITLSHSLLKLLHDSGRRRAKETPQLGPLLDGPMQSLLDLVFESDSRAFADRLRRGARLVQTAIRRRWTTPRYQAGLPFEKVLDAEVGALLANPDFRRALHEASSTDERIFLVVSTLVNRIFARYLSNLRQHPGLSLIGALKELVALVSSHLFVALPYLVAFLHQASDSLISRDVRASFQLRQRPKIALLTDTFFEINGVAMTIRRMIREAERRDIALQVITCLGAEEQKRLLGDLAIRQLIAAGRLKIFTAIANVDFPQYDGLQVRFPPLLELLKHLQEEGFTKMQISTPGTIGCAGLLAAKILQIETAATYHTCFPEYVENYTRDVSLEALAWKYMIGFYHGVDEVIVPSRFVAKLLHKRGLRKRKLLILDRWVDVERFHPRNRSATFWERYGIGDAARLVKFVYVGRLGVEKNLSVIAAAYRRLRSERSDLHLIVVGDGPYRAELERQLAGLPVTWTGFLQGDELARAVASADVKLFPSTTDTWGNAPLEAQASGLPVIVANAGGPPELMLDGVTGLKIEGADASSLATAMVALMDDGTRLRMGVMARAFAEANKVEEPFSAVLDAETYRQRWERQKHSRPSDELRLPGELIEIPEVGVDGDLSLAGALFG
jgi:glycosyltransferase involved in cell wall biosynthesis